MEHLPHAREAEDVDGSLGSVGPAIDSVIEMWHELTANDADYGPAEPLLRARFIEYLSSPSDGDDEGRRLPVEERAQQRGGFLGHDRPVHLGPVCEAAIPQHIPQ